VELFEHVKNFLDQILGPVTFFLISVGGLAAVIVFRSFWTRPRIAATILVFLLAFFLVSITDPDLAVTVKKPDNVPILIMLCSLGFFLWMSFRKMVINDELIAKGLPTVEARESRKRVLCWPDLLYEEFLILIICSVLLTWWAIELKAPLEEPASQTKTPNPSKAPWYFLGLQEMLLYYDPWLAGVVFPSMIIGGLMALPYIDPNPKGNGYYTFKERPFAISTFLFGFVVLWLLLIMMGTFLRGPNWNFFGFYETWDVHKLAPLTNVNLSEYFYNHLLKRPLPDSILLRELPGFLLVIGYFVVLPPILASTVFRRIYQEMGFIRFNVMANLLLFMAALPIKMSMRWLFNLKYIVAIPEKFFNI
jgi:hypothetical protein